MTDLCGTKIRNPLFSSTDRNSSSELLMIRGTPVERFKLYGFDAKQELNGIYKLHPTKKVHDRETYWLELEDDVVPGMGKATKSATP